MWQAISYVSTGITMVAFLAAVGAYVYRHKLGHTERLIRTASGDERAKLVADTLEFFRIDTAGLTREQRFELALKQIEERGRRFRVAAITIVVVAMMCITVALYAIFRNGNAAKGQLDGQANDGKTMQRFVTEVTVPFFEVTRDEARQAAETLRSVTHLMTEQTALSKADSEAGERRRLVERLLAQVGAVQSLVSNLPPKYVVDQLPTYQQLTLDLKSRGELLEAFVRFGDQTNLNEAFINKTLKEYEVLQARIGPQATNIQRFLQNESASQARNLHKLTND